MTFLGTSVRLISFNSSISRSHEAISSSSRLMSARNRSIFSFMGMPLNNHYVEDRIEQTAQKAVPILVRTSGHRSLSSVRSSKRLNFGCLVFRPSRGTLLGNRYRTVAAHDVMRVRQPSRSRTSRGDLALAIAQQLPIGLRRNMRLSLPDFRGSGWEIS